MKIHSRSNDKGAMPAVHAEGDEVEIRRIDSYTCIVEVKEPVMELVPRTDEEGKRLFRQGPNNTKGKALSRWVHKRDPETGELLYETRQRMKKGSKRGFVKYSDNWQMTEEEKARNAKQRAITELNEGLAAELVESGISAKDLIAAVRGLKSADTMTTVSDTVAAAEDGEKAAPGDDSAFPRHKGGPHWVLSDGSAFKGTKDRAIQAESQLAGAA